MPTVFQSHQEAKAFVQARLDTRDWWTIPVATADAAELITEVADQFYTDENRLLFDMVLFLTTLPDVPMLWLVLASKSCMSARQFADMAGLAQTPDVSRDVIVTASTPLSVMVWLYSQFNWPLPESRSH